MALRHLLLVRRQVREGPQDLWVVESRGMWCEVASSRLWVQPRRPRFVTVALCCGVQQRGVGAEVEG